jgi:ribonucleoside-diphosphate reductase alpha chain
VIEIPQKAPANSILRDKETALQLLERIKLFNLDWVRAGHRKGDNTNNVSATISIKENEWKEVGEWMWSNRDTFNGLSILPYDGGSYTQAPFENISKSKYYSMINALQAIDLRKVKELDDNTTRSQEIACAGGSCEIV